MKGKIIIKKTPDMIHFYWTHHTIGKLYLFSQKFSKGVFDFFCPGRSITEVLNFRQWNRNPKLDKTITKLPLYMKYARKEYTRSLITA
jgi:hypothetical protein